MIHSEYLTFTNSFNAALSYIIQFLTLKYLLRSNARKQCIWPHIRIVYDGLHFIQARPTSMILLRELSCFTLNLLKLYTLRSIRKNTTKMSEKAL